MFVMSFLAYTALTKLEYYPGIHTPRMWRAPPFDSSCPPALVDVQGHYGLAAPVTRLRLQAPAPHGLYQVR